jgi:hypothetical protein
MDIHAFLSADTAKVTETVTLGKDPETGKEFGVVVVGRDSPQYRAEQTRQRFEGAKRTRDENKPGAQKVDYATDEGQAILAERTEQYMRAYAVACTVDWFGFESQGEPAPYHPKLIEQLYTARPSYVDRVLSVVDDGARFLPKPAKA